ncbi:MAG: hypothetical protein WA030_00505, partial [Candidatus Microsaccharimonas sp.]
VYGLMYPESPQLPVTPPMQPPKPSRKKLIVVIISIIVVAVTIGVGTILILGTLKEDTPTQTHTTITLKEVDAPEVIISDYEAASIDSRSSYYTQRQAIANDGTTTPTEPSTTENPISGPTNTIITYADKDSFDTTVPVTEHVQYERTDKSANENAKEVIDQTKSFLEKKGLVNISTSTTESGVIYTNFDSTNVYCQTTESAIDPVYPPTFGVACVLKTFITDRYTQINALLKLAPTEYTDAKAITIGLDVTEATHKLTTLEVTLDDSTKILIFAAQNDTWEYIGERPMTNPDDARSFVISDTLKTAINDPEWNGFLTKYIK